MTLHVSRAGRMALTLALSFALLTLFEGVAKCQSPSVTLVNLTSGNNQVFNVGDYFEVVVFGPLYEEVDAWACQNSNCSESDMGSINASGNLLLTGQMGSEDIGNWTETWYVGGVFAGSFSFVVQQQTVCVMSASANPPLVVSVDYLYYDNTIDFTSSTPSVATGSVSPTNGNYCAMYGESIWSGPSMDVNLQSSNGIEAAFSVEDDTFRPGYWYSGPGYYPYYDSTGIIFEGIDSNSNLYLAELIVPLVVTWTWDY